MAAGFAATSLAHADIVVRGFRSQLWLPCMLCGAAHHVFIHFDYWTLGPLRVALPLQVQEAVFPKSRWAQGRACEQSGMWHGARSWRWVTLGDEDNRQR